METIKTKNLELPEDKRTPLYRFFEILPGSLSILILILPVVLAFINPVAATIFILIFTLAWFFRTMPGIFHMLRGFKRMQKVSKGNWNNILHQDLSDPEASLQLLIAEPKSTFLEKFRISMLESYLSKSESHFDYQQDVTPTTNREDLVHLILLPTVKEDYEVVEETVKALSNSNYNVKGQVVLMLCPEGRAAPFSTDIASRIKQKYQTKFKDILISIHPVGLEHEIIGKGSNLQYSIDQFTKYFKKNKIEDHQVLITQIDADHIVHKEYLANLSYTFLLTPDPHNAAYNPILLYTNNIWESPWPIKVSAIADSLFTMLQASRPHLQRNFSTHSQSLLSLRQTDFWSKLTIVEDGHQYWRSYMAFKGRYRVKSLYIPLYIDAVMSQTYYKTLIARYKQMRRWAYGCSDIPYVATRGLWGKQKIKGVPFFPTLGRWLRLLDNHISWSSRNLILALGAWVPVVISRVFFDRNIVTEQLPSLVSKISQLTLVGVVLTIYITIKILPNKKPYNMFYYKLLMLIQLIGLSVFGIIYSTLSGFSAQLHMLSGKYLEVFDVTEKHRKGKIIN